MKVKQLISAFPTFQKERPESRNNHLKVSEFFYDSIQGEGINIGVPASFLRLQHCVLDCAWCDTTEVWRKGNPYTFDQLFVLMEPDLIRKLQNGQHLVITGGSPLMQQMQLVFFIRAFIARYDFKPYIEIENECVLEIALDLLDYVDCWNNSPKLSNSGNIKSLQYQPRVLETLAKVENSWFKFVISNEKDWEEIVEDFLDPKLIRKDQIILMPEGQTRKQIMTNNEMVVDLAIENNVRYTTREHIILWDNTTGV